MKRSFAAGAMTAAWLVLFSGCARSPEPPRVDVSSIDPALATNIQAARTAVVSAPKSADAWGKLGQAFHAAEFTGEAGLCYSNAAALDATSARWLYLLGTVELQETPESAIEHLTRAVQLGGVNVEAPRFALARALVERGRHDEALPHLQLLLAANPNHAAARLELGRVQVARGNVDEALRILQPALTNSFTARPAMLLLSQIEQRRGHAEVATQLARRAGMLPRPFDWPDPFLREVQNLRADRQRLADQANALIQQQRTRDAEAVLQRLLTSFPEDAEGLLLLGRLRYVEKNCAAAEQAYRKHLAVQPKSLNGLIQLALSLLCQQRWTDGIAVLEQTIALKPDFAQAHVNLGYARGRAGDSAGAIRAYREAIRCNPGDLSAHIALADELARAGQRSEAVATLDRASAINPSDPRLQQLRARLGNP